MVIAIILAVSMVVFVGGMYAFIRHEEKKEQQKKLKQEIKRIKERCECFDNFDRE